MVSELLTSGKGLGEAAPTPLVDDFAAKDPSDVTSLSEEDVRVVNAFLLSRGIVETPPGTAEYPSFSLNDIRAVNAFIFSVSEDLLLEQSSNQS